MSTVYKSIVSLLCCSEDQDVDKLIEDSDEPYVLEDQDEYDVENTNKRHHNKASSQNPQQKKKGGRSPERVSASPHRHSQGVANETIKERKGSHSSTTSLATSRKRGNNKYIRRSDTTRSGGGDGSGGGGGSYAADGADAETAGSKSSGSKRTNHHDSDSSKRNSTARNSNGGDVTGSVTDHKRRSPSPSRPDGTTTTATTTTTTNNDNNKNRLFSDDGHDDDDEGEEEGNPDDVKDAHATFMSTPKRGTLAIPKSGGGVVAGGGSSNHGGAAGGGRGGGENVRHTRAHSNISAASVVTSTSAGSAAASTSSISLSKSTPGPIAMKSIMKEDKKTTTSRWDDETLKRFLASTMGEGGPGLVLQKYNKAGDKKLSRVVKYTAGPGGKSSIITWGTHKLLGKDNSISFSDVSNVTRDGLMITLHTMGSGTTRSKTVFEAAKERDAEILEAIFQLLASQAKK